MHVIMLLMVWTAGAEQPKLADVGWLAGSWKNDPSEKTTFEESWTAPVNGSMIGTFKLAANGKVGVYEFQLIEQEADGAWLRLRHCGSGMVDRDEKPLTLKLTEASDKKLIWTNPEAGKPKKLVYERDGAGKLTVSVETTRDGQPARFMLRFVRAGTK